MLPGTLQRFTLGTACFRASGMPSSIIHVHKEFLIGAEISHLQNPHKVQTPSAIARASILSIGPGASGPGFAQQQTQKDPNSKQRSSGALCIDHTRSFKAHKPCCKRLPLQIADDGATMLKTFE